MFDDAARGARRLPRIAHFLPPHGPPPRVEWDLLMAADGARPRAYLHHRTPLARLMTTGAARWAGADRARHPPALSGHDLMRMFPAESPESLRARRRWPASSGSGYFADEERRYFARREALNVCPERVVRARAGNAQSDDMHLLLMGGGTTHPVSDGVVGTAGDGADNDDGKDEDVVGGCRMEVSGGEGTPPTGATRPSRARDRKSAAEKHHAPLNVRRPHRVEDRAPDTGPGRPGTRHLKEPASALGRSVPARALGMGSDFRQGAGPVPSPHVPSYMLAASIPVLRVSKG